MARVVYGVAGEGFGHASRSREVLEHLRERGHALKVATYDRGWKALAPHFDCTEVEGLSLGTSDNRVSLVATFTENLAKLSDSVRSLRTAKRVLFEEFRPEVVITDFEPLSAHLARHFEVPLVSLDNQHLVRYVDFPCPAGLLKGAQVMKAIVRAMVPRPDVALVTSFYSGRVSNDRTFLFPPIVGRDVRALVPSRNGGLLAYFTKGFDEALEVLAGFPERRFVVYGYDREEQRGNLVLAKASRERFLADLAACDAVVATAGLTLMGEALQLGKSLLALPMRGQFEQELNAALLADAGYGANGRELSGRTLADFLAHLAHFEQRLAERPPSDNSALFAQLDRLLDDGAALARAFRARRVGAA